MSPNRVHLARPAFRRARRRRRPVGEPPPIPRNLHGAASIWFGLVLTLVIVYFMGKRGPVLGSTQRAVDRAVAEVFSDVREAIGSGVGRGIRTLFPWGLLIALRWAVVVALVLFRRWRHLAVFVVSVVGLGAWARWFPTAGVEGTGIPGHPSEAMAGLAAAAMGVLYGLVTPGRARRFGAYAAAGILVLFGVSVLAVGRDSFVELVTGAAAGLAAPILGYRIFAPESVFPVAYGAGRTAHLDCGGERGHAICRALRDQLGLGVSSIEPFGLGNSGGCTPLRITTDDGRALFGKLYATNHLRADRWYKLGRTIRYGALEDERSFNSVRHMAEYEDYMLRYLRDEGVPSAAPVGFVELTPEREYLLISEFVDDAVELREADVTAGVIRSGLDLVRALWDAGLAHRDLKPSNLLVRRGEVVAIDVFFCQVHPSPWRQSVDLANMLLTLALRSDPEIVYRIALERFTPDEVAEAFAASRSVTIPAQLRRELARDGRDLISAFRELAPHRDLVRIQRWTVRRLALTSGLAAGAAVGVAFAFLSLQPAGFRP